ncbi:MAG: gamma-glutamyltransferase [Desulfobacterales bacterium]|nr:gamma-glutamyltransferase [Desulfobacterales bacterium]
MCCLLLSTSFAGAVTTQSTLESKKGMVVAAHPLAAKAGAEILEQGGNAVDAAIAVSFAIGVVEPYGSGLGGEGYALMDLAGKGITAIDFRSTAPALASYKNLKKAGMKLKEAKYTPKGHCVPGLPAGVAKAYEMAGTLPLATLIAPAVELAEKGFPVSKTFAKVLNDNYDKILENTPEFLDDGLPWNEGDILTNPALANTLRIIAEQGIDAYYHGVLADNLDAYMQENDGFMRKSDLEGYKVIVTEPVHTTYKGHDVYTSGYPVGGPRLVNLLNILEHFDFGTMGTDDPLALHIMQEAFVLAALDQRVIVGDPAFAKDMPKAGYASKDYARARVMQIALDKASNPDSWKKRRGTPEHYNQGQDYRDVLMGRTEAPKPEADSGADTESGSTTHFAVMDSQGNAVTWTQTISALFGSGCMVDGYFLNTELGNFKYKKLKNDAQKINIEPGKRPRTNLTPTIVKKDGKVRWLLGTPGGSRIVTTTAQILVGVVEQGLTLKEAVDAPKMAGYDTYKELRLEDKFSPKTIEVLEEVFGHDVKPYAYPHLYFGGPNVIEAKEDGTLIGVGSMRRQGGAASPN